MQIYLQRNIIGNKSIKENSSNHLFYEINISHGYTWLDNIFEYLFNKPSDKKHEFL